MLKFFSFFYNFLSLNSVVPIARYVTIVFQEAKKEDGAGTFANAAATRFLDLLLPGRRLLASDVELR